jgi:alpha-beta hydrolase superfamily lysophospholipase
MYEQAPSLKSRQPKSGLSRLRRLLLIFVGLPYVAVLVLLGLFQRSLLFPAARAESLPASNIMGHPADRVRDVEITTSDGLTIRGWLFLASDADVASAETDDRWLVIYFHGNAGHRGNRVPVAREFVRQGCDVLLIDYRGYGDSEGSPSREGLVLDALATWEYSIRDLNRNADRIVLFGESLGGAVAVELASRCCLEGGAPAGMLLTSTFASLPETAARLYPAFPVYWVVRDRFCSRDLIPHVTCPIVQVHGKLDELVTLDEAKELFEEAPAASAGRIPKRFEVIEHADHNSVPPEALGNALRELLDALDAA